MAYGGVAALRIAIVSDHALRRLLSIHQDVAPDEVEILFPDRLDAPEGLPDE